MNLFTDLSNRTGVTGYIGGSVFTTLIQRHPEYDITVLLRNPPEDFGNLFPNVKVIKGNFDSTDVISNAAADAEVVVRKSIKSSQMRTKLTCNKDCGNSDHENSLKAILTGLLRRNITSFLIHLSGTGILSDFKDTKDYRGRLNPKIYSDIDDIDEITSRPAGSLHRHTDEIIQEYAVKYGDKLKTAIVCPPDIYGRGYGPGRNQSVYFPTFVREIMKIGAPFYLKDGSNTRGWVHIDDLMDVYVDLVEAAVVGGGRSVTWGKDVSSRAKGYFIGSDMLLIGIFLDYITRSFTERHRRSNRENSTC